MTRLSGHVVLMKGQKNDRIHMLSHGLALAHMVFITLWSSCSSVVVTTSPSSVRKALFTLAKGRSFLFWEDDNLYSVLVLCNIMVSYLIAPLSYLPTQSKTLMRQGWAGLPSWQRRTLGVSFWPVCVSAGVGTVVDQQQLYRSSHKD